MKQNRLVRVKTDLDNLRFLYRLNRAYNSPRSINSSRYNRQSYSRNTNNSRTIYLQRTNPISFFPVRIKLLKKDMYNYSYSPELNIYYSPSRAGLNSNSLDRNSLNKVKQTPQNRRTYNQVYTNNTITSNENDQYRNLRRIKRLKNSLGNPKFAKNVMDTNNLRNNRFVSVSPSQNSYQEERREKSNEQMRNIEIEIDENNFDNNNNFNNFKGNTNKYFNRTFNNRFYPNKYFRNNFIKNYNNKSPGIKSNNSDNNPLQVNTGNRPIYNIPKKFGVKNMAQILSAKTPNIIPIKENIIQEEIHLNDFNFNKNANNIFLINNNVNNAYKIIEIKLDDLIFIEGRLNDIILALNDNKNIFDIDAINESVEFFVFYFHSSLKNKIPLFFNEPNRIVIKSAFNLNLFVIILTYHLSLNPSMLGTVIILLKKMYELLKMNLFLFIRKIQLYYGDDFCRKNDTYFRTANYFLGRNGLINVYENEIINIVNKNCISIVNDVNNILNYYKAINNIFYPDFHSIYLNISRMNEQDINNYFYNYLFNSTKENMAAQQRINRFDYSRDNIENSKFYENNNNNININNIINNTTFQNQNQNYLFRQEEDENEQLLNNIILSYKKNKELPPFLKNKNQKKYTLILDLEDTLVNISITNDKKIIIQPRPGLISFLTGIKPFYEIIAFSKLSKNYSESIIRLIEGDKKLFDYNLHRNHCALIGKNFVKDITRIGRDIKTIIIVDDIAENLKDHIDNGILILPYDVNNFREDRVLFELKKMLILFHRLGYQDLRNALKSYKSEIYHKITLGLDD